MKEASRWTLPPANIGVFESLSIKLMLTDMALLLLFGSTQ